MGYTSTGAGYTNPALFYSQDAAASTGFNNLLGLVNSGGGQGIQFNAGNLGIGSLMQSGFGQSEDMNPAFVGAMSGVTSNIDNLAGATQQYFQAAQTAKRATKETMDAANTAKAAAKSNLAGAGMNMGVGVVGGLLSSSKNKAVSGLGDGISNYGGNLVSGIQGMAKASKAAKAAGTVAKGTEAFKNASGQTVGAGIGIVGSMANKAIGADYGTWGNAAGSLMDTGANLLFGTNPVTMGLYWGTKLINSGLNKAIGASNYDVGDQLLNNVIGIGTLNNALGKQLANFDYDRDKYAAMGGGYTDLSNEALWGAKHSGQKAGGLLHNAGAIQNRMDDLMLKDARLSNVYAQQQSADIGASMGQQIGIGTNFSNNGGWQQGGTHFGKQGMKFDTSFAKKALALQKTKKEAPTPVETTEVEAYKNGGTFNVIPDGALHKNKHHLSDIDEKFEEVTQKGVPVITESEGGEITQHAEVEINEIIFRLEVTKELEKLMKEHTDDAAIEAGKLLVEEILRNTHDNTGLLEAIE